MVVFTFFSLFCSLRHQRVFHAANSIFLAQLCAAGPTSCSGLSNGMFRFDHNSITLFTCRRRLVKRNSYKISWQLFRFPCFCDVMFWARKAYRPIFGTILFVCVCYCCKFLEFQSFPHCKRSFLPYKHMHTHSFF